MESPTLNKKLGVILHRGWIQARELARGQTQQQLHDLADCFEGLTAHAMAEQPIDADQVRLRLLDYQTKYPGTAFDFLAMLEMDDNDFETTFYGPWNWPAAVQEIAPQPSTSASAA